MEPLLATSLSAHEKEAGKGSRADTQIQALRSRIWLSHEVSGLLSQITAPRQVGKNRDAPVTVVDAGKSIVKGLTDSASVHTQIQDTQFQSIKVRVFS